MIHAVTSAASTPSPFVTGVLYPSMVAGFVILAGALGVICRVLLKSLANLTVTMAVIEAADPETKRRLTDVEDVLEEVRTHQAVDHSTLRDHLAWHERQAKT